jgi:outer membrane receptor protein involved in Fe transport
LLSALLALVPAGAWADGIVSGVVIDGLTGQPVRGATLSIEGAEVSLSSDLSGAFRADVAPGSYSVVVTKDGFEAQRITDVVVEDHQVADFAVVLLPASDVAAAADLVSESGEVAGDAAFTGEITVVAEAAKSTEAALLAERKQASDISDSIGKQEMSKNTGSDAASVLQRVTGISLQQDKYVFVRGLGERYSNTSLNGSRIPTTEYDKKVVPLDLFPAKLLDKVRVSKSYRPDQPGDFAAGLVEMETLDFPVEPTLTLSLGTKTNSMTTGDSFGEYLGGLSFSGGGGQPLPGIIPGDELRKANPFLSGGFTPEELQTFGQAFVGAWSADNADIDYSGAGFKDGPTSPNFSLSYGGTHGPLGLVLSATHANGFSHREENQKFFALSGGGELRATKDYDFVVDTENVRRGLVGNFNFRLHPNHKIELRTLFTDDSSAESRLFEGFNEDDAADVRNYRVRYNREEIVSTQLKGEHFFEGLGSGSLLEWRGTYSKATKEENLRESLYKEERPGVFELAQESQSAFLLFNDLEDRIDEYGADWTQFFSASKLYGSVKLGGALSSRDRDFGSRRFRYLWGGLQGLDLTLLPDQLLIPENIHPDGFEIQESTRGTDFYTATHDVSALYAMADVTFGRWRLIGGLRGEQSEIEVITQDPYNIEATPVVSNVDDNELMPSLSVVYRLNEQTNLRAAVAQTVNRPEFRELAPFEFTDVAGGRSAVGNPDLTSATIRSYDLRWEWFPNSFGVVAASAFYKDFSNPIERTLLFGIEQISTWRNVDMAENYGLELEFRRDLGFLSETLRPLVLQLNYTWVESQINVGADSIETNPERALVGQPDQVYNVVLEWTQPAWGSTARVLFNHSGDKIAEAGAFGIPDVVEQARSTLDLVWRQDLRFISEGLSLKLSANNITDEEIALLGGMERVYTTGRTVSLSLSYTPF